MYLKIKYFRFKKVTDKKIKDTLPILLQKETRAKDTKYLRRNKQRILSFTQFKNLKGGN